MSGALRRGYRDVERVRPDVEWADPPEDSGMPEVDWAWVAALLAERPDCWLRVVHPVPGGTWRSNRVRVSHYAPFRPIGSHEAVVVNGCLYLRKVSAFDEGDAA